MYSWQDIVQMMKNWIDESLEDDTENTRVLAQMTERLGYSYSYASKKFHEIEGTPFREYISNRRAEQAAANLAASREKIIDIALRCGYSSQETFTRAFKRHYGITPGTYRKNLEHGGQEAMSKIGRQTAKDMHEAIRCLQRMGELLGKQHPMYRMAIDGLAKEMNTDIDLMLEDERLTECLVMEAIIYSMATGNRFDAEDVKVNFKYERWYNIFVEYAEKYQSA